MTVYEVQLWDDEQSERLIVEAETLLEAAGILEEDGRINDYNYFSIQKGDTEILRLEDLANG